MLFSDARSQGSQKHTARPSACLITFCGACRIRLLLGLPSKSLVLSRPGQSPILWRSSWRSLNPPARSPGEHSPASSLATLAQVGTFAFQDAAMQALHGTSPFLIMHVYLSKVTFERIAVTALACLLPATQHTNGTALRDVTKCTP